MKRPSFLGHMLTLFSSAANSCSPESAATTSRFSKGSSLTRSSTVNWSRKGGMTPGK